MILADIRAKLPAFARAKAAKENPHA